MAKTMRDKSSYSMTVKFPEESNANLYPNPPRIQKEVMDFNEEMEELCEHYNKSENKERY